MCQNLIQITFGLQISTKMLQNVWEKKSVFKCILGKLLLLGHLLPPTNSWGSGTHEQSPQLITAGRVQFLQFLPPILLDGLFLLGFISDSDCLGQVYLEI